MPSPFPASEAVLSVNVGAADESGCALGAWLSCKTPSGAWSPWYTMLRWGAIDEEIGVISDDSGAVDVDILRLNTPADHWRYRIAWHDPSGQMYVRRVALSLHSDTPAPPVSSDAPGVTDPALPVPFCSQWDINGFPPDRVCSPTALAMVAQYHGLDTTPEHMARLAHDEQHDIYGNWAMNMLAASRVGLDAYIDRGTGLEYLAAALQMQQPVIASIAYGDGDLTGAPVPASTGHLVVVTGINRESDVIVRDPAARGKDVWMTYNGDQFLGAWLGHGGVVYRITRDQQP